MAKDLEVARNRIINLLISAIVVLLLFVGKIWYSEVVAPLIQQGLPAISNKALLSLAIVQLLAIAGLIALSFLLYRILKKERKAATEKIGFAMVSHKLPDDGRRLLGDSQYPRFP